MVSHDWVMFCVCKWNIKICINADFSFIWLKKDNRIILKLTLCYFFDNFAIIQYHSVNMEKLKIVLVQILLAEIAILHVTIWLQTI